MNRKEQYIKLFDLIRTIFENNGFRSGFNEFPKDISDYFRIDFEYEKLDKRHLPNFIFTIENIETKLKTKIIIGAGNLLFALNLLDYRKRLIAEGFSGIVTTKKTFFKNTGATFAIIIFSEKSENKYFSTVEDSEDLFNVIFNKNSARQKIFYSNEINEENLTPEHYNRKATAIKKLFSNYKTIKLGKIAEVIDGAKRSNFDLFKNGFFSSRTSISGSCYKVRFVENKVPYLRSKCLKNGKITPDEFCVEESDCKKFAKQLLQEGDILVTKHFGQNTIAFVTEDDLPAIASNQLIIIRPHSVSAFNLYKYLSSNAGKMIFGQQLTEVSTSSALKMINIQSLKEIEIPMLDINSANQFESEFETNHKKAFNDILLDAESAINQIGESELKKSIRNDLINAGWNDSDIISDYRIYMKDRCFISDLMLLNNNKPLACIEMKISSLNKDILAHLIKENMKQDNILLIATISPYYEVYRIFDNELKVFKFYEPPKKEDLLKIQKEGK